MSGVRAARLWGGQSCGVCAALPVQEFGYFRIVVTGDLLQETIVLFFSIGYFVPYRLLILFDSDKIWSFLDDVLIDG